MSENTEVQTTRLQTITEMRIGPTKSSVGLMLVLDEDFEAMLKKSRDIVADKNTDICIQYYGKTYDFSYQEFLKTLGIVLRNDE